MLLNSRRGFPQREHRSSEEEDSGEIETRRRVRVRRGCAVGDGIGVAVLCRCCGSGYSDTVRCAAGGDGECDERDSFSVKASRLALINCKFVVLRYLPGAILASIIRKILAS